MSQWAQGVRVDNYAYHQVFDFDRLERAHPLRKGSHVVPFGWPTRFARRRDRARHACRRGAASQRRARVRVRCEDGATAAGRECEPDEEQVEHVVFGRRTNRPTRCLWPVCTDGVLGTADVDTRQAHNSKPLVFAEAAMLHEAASQQS